MPLVDPAGHVEHAAGSIAVSSTPGGVEGVVVGGGGEAGLELGLVHPSAAGERELGDEELGDAPQDRWGAHALGQPGQRASALSPVSTNRNRRADTGGKATVRTGTALAAGLDGAATSATAR